MDRPTKEDCMVSGYPVEFCMLFWRKSSNLQFLHVKYQQGNIHQIVEFMVRKPFFHCYMTFVRKLFSRSVSTSLNEKFNEYSPCTYKEFLQQVSTFTHTNLQSSFIGLTLRPNNVNSCMECPPHSHSREETPKQKGLGVYAPLRV